MVLTFAALTCFTFADRKKIRETNPIEDKFPKAEGESPLPPPGTNPMINSTSSPSMALISNALAVYTYVSGRETNDYFRSLLKQETSLHYLG